MYAFEPFVVVAVKSAGNDWIAALADNAESKAETAWLAVARPAAVTPETVKTIFSPGAYEALSKASVTVFGVADESTTTAVAVAVIAAEASEKVRVTVPNFPAIEVTPIVAVPAAAEGTSDELTVVEATIVGSLEVTVKGMLGTTFPSESKATTAMAAAVVAAVSAAIVPMATVALYEAAVP